MYNVDKIFELLKERKLEQKDLAEAIGVSAGNITEWKKGRAKPSANIIPKIADYFGLPLSDFYIYENPQETKKVPIKKSIDDLKWEDFTVVFDGSEHLTKEDKEKIVEHYKFTYMQRMKKKAEENKDEK